MAANRKESSKKLSFNNVPGHVIPDLLAAVNRKEDGETLVLMQMISAT